jgi:hypothetical protein
MQSRFLCREETEAEELLGPRAVGTSRRQLRIDASGLRKTLVLFTYFAPDVGPELFDDVGERVIPDL